VAPGDDAWFRVLDKSGRRPLHGDGLRGHIPEFGAYCAEQPWPDSNARTHPVTSGQITVHAGP